MSRWQLTRKGSFIDISGVDPIGHEPDLTEQIEPTRRRGGKHEDYHKPASPAQMEHAYQRKQAPRRVVVDGNFIGEPLHQ